MGDGDCKEQEPLFLCAGYNEHFVYKTAPSHTARLKKGHRQTITYDFITTPVQGYLENNQKKKPTCINV